MKNRCRPSHREAHSYYERDIKVCDRWLNSFENFLADVGTRPSSQHSLDRIDVNGNYEPSNVRWALLDVQANNKRKVRDLEARIKELEAIIASKA